MQVIYSAFYDVPQGLDLPSENYDDVQELTLRLHAHQQVCEKYREEIKRIQEYLPNWKPAFGGL